MSWKTSRSHVSILSRPTRLYSHSYSPREFVMDILAGSKSSLYHIHFRVKKRKLQWAEEILQSYNVLPFSTEYDYYSKELFKLYPQQKSITMCIQSSIHGHDYCFKCDYRRQYSFAFKEETLRYFLFLRELSGD